MMINLVLEGFPTKLCENYRHCENNNNNNMYIVYILLYILLYSLLIHGSAYTS